MNLENLIKYYFKKDLYTLLLYPNNTFSLLLYGDNYDFLSLQSKKKLANSKKYSQKFDVKSKFSNQDDEDFSNEDLDSNNKKNLAYEEGLYMPNQIYIRRRINKARNNKKNKRRNKNKHDSKELYQLHLKQHHKNVYKFRPLVKLNKQVSYILQLAIDNYLTVLKKKLNNLELTFSTHHLEYSKWYLPSSDSLNKIDNLNTSVINLTKDNIRNSIKENDQKILQLLSVYLFHMFTYKKRVSEVLKKSKKLSPLVKWQKIKYDTIFDVAYAKKREHLYWPRLNYGLNRKSLNKNNKTLFDLDRIERIKEFETYLKTSLKTSLKWQKISRVSLEDYAKNYINFSKIQVKKTDRNKELQKIKTSINDNKYKKLADLKMEAQKWKVSVHPLIHKAIRENRKLTTTERKLIQIIRQRIIDAKKMHGNRMKTRQERFRNPSILSRIQDFKNKLENLQLIPIHGTSLRIQHILHNKNSWWIITNVDNKDIQSLTDSNTILGQSHIKIENENFPLYSLLTEKDLSRYLVSVFSAILRWNGKKKAGESRKSKFQDPLFLSQMLLEQEFKELPKAFKINGISIKLSGRLYKSRLTLSQILSQGYVYENDFRYLSKSAYRTRASLIGLKLKTSTSLPRDIK